MSNTTFDWQLTKHGDPWDDGTQWWNATLMDGAAVLGQLIAWYGTPLYHEECLYGVVCPVYFGNAEWHDVPWAEAVKIFESEAARWFALGG